MTSIKKSFDIPKEEYIFGQYFIVDKISYVAYPLLPKYCEISAVLLFFYAYVSNHQYHPIAIKQVSFSRLSYFVLWNWLGVFHEYHWIHYSISWFHKSPYDMMTTSTQWRHFSSSFYTTWTNTLDLTRSAGLA